MQLINLRDEYGKTILRNAIDLKKHEHIEILCQFDASPFIEDDNGEHAFHDTAKLGDLKTLRLLLKSHSNDPRWENIRKNHNSQLDGVKSPLYYAQKNGHEPYAFIFKNFHKYNNDPITKAIIFGDIDDLIYKAIKAINRNKHHSSTDKLISKILNKKFICADSNYCTTLTFTILLQDYEMVKFLLENGAGDSGSFITKYLAKDIPNDINKLLKKYYIQVIPRFKQYPIKNCKQMALSNAVLGEDENKVNKALNKTGAKINGFDYKGNTALHWACTIGSPEMIDLLLQKKGNPNMVDRVKHRTGLHWLLRMHKKSVKKNGTQIASSIFLPCLFMLISEGANPEINDGYGKTFFYWINKNFKEHDKKLVYRILKVKQFSHENRRKLLEDIFDFQMRQMNKWHLGSKNFNLRDVAHIKSVLVKVPNKDLDSQDTDFKPMYKKYL